MITLRCSFQLFTFNAAQFTLFTFTHTLLCPLGPKFYWPAGTANTILYRMLEKLYLFFNSFEFSFHVYLFGVFVYSLARSTWPTYSARIQKKGKGKKESSNKTFSPWTHLTVSPMNINSHTNKCSTI